MSEKELKEKLGDAYLPLSQEFTDKSTNIIKVIGVGGGGGNAVKNMYIQGVHNVSFAICNTDSQALVRSEVPSKLQLGETGLGVGGNPTRGREEAESSVEAIKNMFGAETKMVFITAGMGGGTGTGAAPVIARIARDMGILTVGVVTLPFAFEKRLRIEKALLGVAELKKNVDALLVINNERLMDIYNDSMTTVSEAFQKADDILTVATKSIAEIITVEGKVNRDFCDVQTVLRNGGGAIMAEGVASGEHRILVAMNNALNSPLLNNVEIEKAQRLLYIIYQSKKSPVLINELNEINGFMDNLANDLEVLWGLYDDDTLGDDVKVTIIATGFDKEREIVDQRRDENDMQKLMQLYYGRKEEEKKAVEPKVEEVEEKKVEDGGAVAEGGGVEIVDSADAEATAADTMSEIVEGMEAKDDMASSLLENDASDEGEDDDDEEEDDAKQMNWSQRIYNFLSKMTEV